MQTYMKIGYMHIKIAPPRTKNGEYFWRRFLLRISLIRMIKSDDLRLFAGGRSANQLMSAECVQIVCIKIEKFQ